MNSYFNWDWLSDLSVEEEYFVLSQHDKVKIKVDEKKILFFRVRHRVYMLWKKITRTTKFMNHIFLGYWLKICLLTSID